MDNINELRGRLQDICGSITDWCYEIKNQIDDIDSLSDDINDVAGEMEYMESNEEKIEEYEEQIKEYKVAVEDLQLEKEVLLKKFADMSEVADSFYTYVCTRIVEGGTTEKNYIRIMGQLSVYRDLKLISKEKEKLILDKLNYVKEEE